MSQSKKVEMTDNGLSVPNNVKIPFIEGDGIGADIWAAASTVFDSAVSKAYDGERSVEWVEVLAGEKSFNINGELIKGKIGKELSLEQGQEAAKFCVLNILAQLKKKCGSLDKVKGCVKLTGYVNSTDSFVDQPKIINRASDLISNIFKLNILMNL